MRQDVPVDVIERLRADGILYIDHPSWRVNAISWTPIGPTEHSVAGLLIDARTSRRGFSVTRGNRPL